MYFRLFIISIFFTFGFTSQITAAPETNAAKNTEVPAKKTTQQTKNEEAMPDAMTHLVKAPEIDFASLRDPFLSYLAVETKYRQQLIEQRKQLDASRERDILESFDLTALKLVAIFAMGEEKVAMVEDPEGKGYSVRIGRHIGKNNGKIMNIDATTVYIVEPNINPVGEIEEKEVKLTLNEVSQ